MYHIRQHIIEKTPQTRLPQISENAMILDMAIDLEPLPVLGSRQTHLAMNSIEAISQIGVLRY